MDKEIETLNKKVHELTAEISRLQNGGCARDQRLTQYCADAAKLSSELKIERMKMAEMRDLINALTQRENELNQKIRDLQQQNIVGNNQSFVQGANRVELIDADGRDVVRYYNRHGATIDIQDNGKTIKVFLSGSRCEPKAGVHYSNE